MPTVIGQQRLVLIAIFVIRISTSNVVYLRQTEILLVFFSVLISIEVVVIGLSSGEASESKDVQIFFEVISKKTKQHEIPDKRNGSI